MKLTFETGCNQQQKAAMQNETSLQGSKVFTSKLETFLNTLSESQLENIRDSICTTKDRKQELISHILCYFLKRNENSENVSHLQLDIKSTVAPSVPSPPSIQENTPVLSEKYLIEESDDDLDETYKPNYTSNLTGTPKKKIMKQPQKAKIPLQVGTTTVLYLGTVVYDRPRFHDATDIFPLGYKCSKRLQSMVDESQKADYIAEIIDGGDVPIFQITCSEDPSFRVEGHSPSAAWGEVLGRIKNRRCSVCGPQFLGFRDLRVVKMIQALPNANLCVNYDAAKAIELTRKPERRISNSPKTKKGHEVKPFPALPHNTQITHDWSEAQKIHNFLLQLDAIRLLFLCEDLKISLPDQISVQDCIRRIETLCKEQGHSIRTFFQQLSTRSLRKIGTYLKNTAAASMNKTELIEKFLERFDSQPGKDDTMQVESKSQKEVETPSLIEADSNKVVGTKRKLSSCSHAGPCHIVFGSCYVGLDL